MNRKWYQGWYVLDWNALADRAVVVGLTLTLTLAIGVLGPLVSPIQYQFTQPSLDAAASTPWGWIDEHGDWHKGVDYGQANVPIMCRATCRSTGKPCGNQTKNGADYCGQHKNWPKSTYPASQSVPENVNLRPLSLISFTSIGL